MPRDYKNGARSKPRGQKMTGALAFAAGLAAGLSVALALYLRGPGAGDQSPRVTEPGPVTPAPVATAPPAPAPRFDFYTILPEMEVKVPDWTLPVPRHEAAVDEAGQRAGAYVLQVGSFQRFEEADRAKAELALRGISAGIERVVINGRDVWFRVRIGPISDLGELAAMRNRLIEAGMDFMVLRIRADEAT